MLEIFLIIIGLLIPLGAARKRRRRGKFIAARVSGTMALGTLSIAIVIAQDLNTGAADNEYFAHSCDLVVGTRGFTAGEGPILIGLAHSGYSVTEIKEALEANGTDFGSPTVMEQNNRMVRDHGLFPIITATEIMNDGRPKRTKLRFRVEDGNDVVIFAYNQSGATLTTGGQIFWNGKVYLTLQ